MDAEEARRSLEQARQSYEASVQPALPRWAPPTCAVLVAAALALAGAGSSNGLLKALTVAAGLLCALAAAQLVLRIRARQGVTGLRGPARQKWRSVAASCVAILICALTATPDTRWIWAGLGIVAGTYTWVSLRKQVRA
ncbi:hypothetical protein [Streptomyces sp. NPDC058280]|uniref:hypothetical protein n=1 Tax=Streptomyces sp. NPDC058280 TaxID=3346419 RepID=UPI0036EA1709